MVVYSFRQVENKDIRNGNILDSIIETVNGTVTFGATPENLSVSLVNGDVRLTIKDQMSLCRLLFR